MKIKKGNLLIIGMIFSVLLISLAFAIESPKYPKLESSSNGAGSSLSGGGNVSGTGCINCMCYFDTNSTIKGIPSAIWNGAYIDINLSVGEGPVLRLEQEDESTGEGLHIFMEQDGGLLPAFRTFKNGNEVAFTIYDSGLVDAEVPIPVTSGGTSFNSYNQGDLIYATTPTILTRLSKNTDATRYLSNTGANNNPAWAQINLANGVTGTLPIENVNTSTLIDSYTLQTNMQSSNPLDSTTYYQGSTITLLGTTDSRNKVYIPKSGTVKSIYFFSSIAFTLGSLENSTIYFRLNNQTDTVITTTHTDNLNFQTDINTTLSIPVSTGDFFEIKWVTPTWATNPQNVRQQAVVYIES